ncbi:hypothetical protein GCM10020000_26260 [Streptomyces olivoverticillatus]
MAHGRAGGQGAQDALGGQQVGAVAVGGPAGVVDGGQLQGGFGVPVRARLGVVVGLAEQGDGLRQDGVQPVGVVAYGLGPGQRAQHAAEDDAGAYVLRRVVGVQWSPGGRFGVGAGLVQQRGVGLDVPQAQQPFGFADGAADGGHGLVPADHPGGDLGEEFGLGGEGGLGRHGLLGGGPAGELGGGERGEVAGALAEVAFDVVRAVFEHEGRRALVEVVQQHLADAVGEFVARAGDVVRGRAERAAPTAGR